MRIVAITVSDQGMGKRPSVSNIVASAMNNTNVPSARSLLAAIGCELSELPKSTDAQLVVDLVSALVQLRCCSTSSSMRAMWIV